ncbi:Zn-dependent alcohol dehydrogenase [Leucobacter sp. gxy201]|uniref:Zn-dependent alcohol dehydrogenase n=1 Tax=Leucobacter sp. gxy201 TaxID=2957200 RepID=UPI003DA08E06
MKAAVLEHERSDLIIQDVEVGSVGPREVLIRTAAAGLCHSDLNHLNGVFEIPRPSVLGHESAGVVVEVGADVEDFAPGDHVITCLATFCGHCDRCLSGRSYLCESTESRRGPGEAPRLHRDGAEMHQFLNVSSFAETLLVHESAVVRIDDRMPLDLAALIGCGVTTGLGAVFNKARVEPGQTVAVLGCGGIGLSAIQGARIAGASEIIAIDLNAEKLGVARRLGATQVLAPEDGDLAEQIREVLPDGVDHALEAVGVAATATAALESLAVGGTATIIGLMPAGRTFPVQGRLLLDDRKLQGAYMGAQNFRVAMPRYVSMYLDGRLDLEGMVSSRMRLEDVNRGFDAMRKGEALRDLIVFDEA